MKDRYDLSYLECLQKSSIFKSFGFRTLTTTACLKCKFTSRRIGFHLQFDLPVSFDPSVSFMNSRASTLYFNRLNDLPMEKVLTVAAIVKPRNILSKVFCSCFYNNGKAASNRI